MRFRIGVAINVSPIAEFDISLKQLSWQQIVYLSCLIDSYEFKATCLQRQLHDVHSMETAMSNVTSVRNEKTSVGCFLLVPSINLGQFSIDCNCLSSSHFFCWCIWNEFPRGWGVKFTFIFLHLFSGTPWRYWIESTAQNFFGLFVFLSFSSICTFSSRQVYWPGKSKKEFWGHLFRIPDSIS